MGAIQTCKQMCGRTRIDGAVEGVVLIYVTPQMRTPPVRERVPPVRAWLPPVHTQMFYTTRSRTVIPVRASLLPVRARMRCTHRCAQFAPRSRTGAPHPHTPPCNHLAPSFTVGHTSVRAQVLPVRERSHKHDHPCVHTPVRARVTPVRTQLLCFHTHGWHASRLCAHGDGCPRARELVSKTFKEPSD